MAEAAPGPVVHADLAAATALAAADEQRAAPRIEVRLPEREGLMDPQTRAPQHHDQRAQPRRMKPAAGVSHDGDDLRHGGWVGRVALALVAGRAASVQARHGGRRPRAAGRIVEHFGHDASLRVGGTEPRADALAERSRRVAGRSYVKSFLRLMTTAGWAAWSSMRRVR